MASNAGWLTLIGIGVVVLAVLVLVFLLLVHRRTQQQAAALEKIEEQLMALTGEGVTPDAVDEVLATEPTYEDVMDRFFADTTVVTPAVAPVPSEVGAVSIPSEMVAASIPGEVAAVSTSGELAGDPVSSEPAEDTQELQGTTGQDEHAIPRTAQGEVDDPAITEVNLEELVAAAETKPHTGPTPVPMPAPRMPLSERAAEEEPAFDFAAFKANLESTVGEGDRLYDTARSGRRYSREELERQIKG